MAVKTFSDERAIMWSCGHVVQEYRLTVLDRNRNLSLRLESYNRNLIRFPTYE